ncbi:NADPH-dependent diflavin oxidoreductase 1 [[Candida] anglica]
MKDHGITILYGSETGNAEDYANLIAKRLRYFQLKLTVSALDEYPLKKLVTDTKILLVVCSTTGQGELPRNAKKFMAFLLKRKLPADLFNHLKVTTFGVGDSSYPKFNYAVRKIQRRLEQLGCGELSARCEADEMSGEGSDGFYVEWEKGVIEGLKRVLGDDEMVEVEQEEHLEVERKVRPVCPPGVVSRSAGTPWATGRGGSAPSRGDDSPTLLEEEQGSTQWPSPGRGQRSVTPPQEESTPEVATTTSSTGQHSSSKGNPTLLEEEQGSTQWPSPGRGQRSVTPPHVESTPKVASNAKVVATTTGQNSSLFKGKMVQNKRITDTSHFQDVRHIIIKSDTPVEYSVGDTVSLLPWNDDNSVELLLQSQPQWLEVADQKVEIEGFPEGSPVSVKGKGDLRSLFKYHLDIMSIPRRSFFMTLWHFCDDSTEDGARERERLKEFGSFDEVEELYNYANRPRRSILETLLEFQGNLKIPLDYVWDLFPKIKPRLFSIASGPNDKGRVEMVVAIVEYRTVIRRVRRGLCTKWLAGMEVGTEIEFGIDRSNLTFGKGPVVMIAPGTGIAPMRSLVESRLPWLVSGGGERRSAGPPGATSRGGSAPSRGEVDDVTGGLLVEEPSSTQWLSPSRGQRSGSDLPEGVASPSELFLFFGCRYHNKDHLFQQQWESLATQAPHFQYFPCHSRDEGSVDKYVQHRLYRERKAVGDLIIDKDAMVFVCGSSGNMPREVRITLVEIIAEKLGVDTEGATRYLSEMENNRRYIQETW